MMHAASLILSALALASTPATPKPPAPNASAKGGTATWAPATSFGSLDKPRLFQLKSRSGTALTVASYPPRGATGAANGKKIADGLRGSKPVLILLDGTETHADLAPIVDMFLHLGAPVLLYWPSKACQGDCVFPSPGVGIRPDPWAEANAVITWAHANTGQRLRLFGTTGGSGLALRAVASRSRVLAAVAVDDVPRGALGAIDNAKLDDGLEAILVIGDDDHGPVPSKSGGGMVEPYNCTIHVGRPGVPVLSVVTNAAYQARVAGFFGLSAPRAALPR